MPRMRPLILIALVAFGTGCSLYRNALRNAINEPTLTWEEHRYQHKARRMASEAWPRFRACQPGAKFSRDFESGYLDGYADYLEAGGAGEPPPFPPRRYMKTRYQTPSGMRAVADYFSGFQQGAQDAIASGQRIEFLLPVAVPVGAVSTVGIFAPSGFPLPSPIAEPLPAPKLIEPR